MKEKSQLEPGLLRTYRLLTWVLTGTSILQTTSLYFRTSVSNQQISPVWIFPLGNILILILLYWPWFRKKTGQFFFPSLIALATINGILQTYLTSMMRFSPDVTISILVESAQSLTIPLEVYEISMVMASWQLVPILFIPLIMVAWQYNFKAVVTYVAASAALDLIVHFFMLGGNESLFSIVGGSAALISRSLTFLIVGFLVSRMNHAQRMQQEELVQANRRLLGYAMTMEQLTTTRERNRLARELHDTLAHTLSGLAVQLGAIKALWGKHETAAREKLDDAIVVTRSGLDETRRALKSLRASPLEDLGLCLAVQELAKTAAERCEAKLSVSMHDIPIEIPPDTSQAFYRAAQEALENIVRHAEAKHISIRFEYKERKLALQVEDDGIAFNTQDLSKDTYGLQGLHERADLIGGGCEVNSQPGKGTSIRFTSGDLAS